MAERDEKTRMVYADPEVVRLGKLAEERKAQGDYDSYWQYRRAMLLRQAEVLEQGGGGRGPVNRV